MDLLSVDSKNHKPTGEKKSSSASLLSDAKVVAEAARAQFGSHPGKYDKAKASGSAAHLLDAASDYGKLDETKGVGKYVQQAEDYLQRYSHKPSNKLAGKPSHAAESQGGYGDLMKAAGGFFNKK